MRQKNVLEYLEATVKRFPDKVAYADDTCELTFREVYDSARAIGSVLHERGYYNEPVVVFLPKHPKTIAAFYGCVTAAISTCQSTRRCPDSGSSSSSKPESQGSDLQ
jgi:acyl-CoA synthetase (AMP-forming)/AMP-acid ligase II